MCFLFAALAAFVVFAAPVHADSGGLSAGAAKADITPPVGIPMWGYGARHDAACTGVLDPLQARALVLGMGGHRIALVSLDLGRAPTRATTAAIRKRVQAEGIDEIFLVGSHTHHGPVLEFLPGKGPQPPYSAQLEDKLVQVILEANKAAKPARWGMGSIQASFNRNRHSKLPTKPVDKELLVMRVEDLNGKPIATAVSLAAHATIQKAELLKYSADWPGAMAAAVEKETGAPCLFLQGAAGDQSPNADNSRGPDEFGARVGKAALDVARAVNCKAPEKSTLETAREDFTFKNRVDLKNPFIKQAFVRSFFKDLVDFYDQEYREGVRPVLTVALLDGKVGFVGVSGEFFSGHALELKRRARLDHLFFIGYCNDYHQYFPTIEGASEGGYGADPGVANAEVGAGEKMMNRALVLLYKMRGKYPDMKAQTAPKAAGG